MYVLTSQVHVPFVSRSESMTILQTPKPRKEGTPVQISTNHPMLRFNLFGAYCVYIYIYLYMYINHVYIYGVYRTSYVGTSDPWGLCTGTSKYHPFSPRLPTSTECLPIPPKYLNIGPFRATLSGRIILNSSSHSQSCIM